MIIGSHVGMSGKEMLLGSAKEAVSYGADTFMFYTGAPQNTRRKDISELNIEPAWEYMKEHGINDIIVHAPYIINLGNSVKPETFSLAVEFLAKEIDRTIRCRSRTLILHPGAHVGAGAEAGTARIIEGLNEVLTPDTDCFIALETMAGKGSEIGRSFEELARIYDGVKCSGKLRVCFDTCHTSDSGYDIIHHFDDVMDEFDRIIGKDQIAVFHINDSKNVPGAAKDRHENIGFGAIGFDALNYIVHHPDFEEIPKILETPYIPSPASPKKSYAPYKYEIEMLRKGVFDPDMKETIIKENENHLDISL
ncbi:MAG TPA: deoxyribonuclease IV [Candidatus Mediterraneibacter pullistercoris]|nr:deoxyribonuclease IV [Candidatus Mediterraneibacter pullistercoris]